MVFWPIIDGNRGTTICIASRIRSMSRTKLDDSLDGAMTAPKT